MSHNKALEHGKEKRKRYIKAKAVGKSHRNHGSCPYKIPKEVMACFKTVNYAEESKK